MGYIQHRVPCCRTKWEEKQKNKIRRNTSIQMDYEMDGNVIYLSFTHPNNEKEDFGPWDFIINGINIFKTYPDSGQDGLYFTDGKIYYIMDSRDYKTGINTIQLVYPGDPEYPAEEAYFKFNLERQDAPISINNDDAISVGDTAVIKITGPEDINGDITLTIDGITFTIDGEEYFGSFDEYGVASIDIERLEAGTHTINIYYSGDTKYNSCTTSININVTRIDPEIEYTKVLDGQSVVIDIRGPRNISGDVTLTIDGVEYVGTFEDGRADILVDGLNSRGTYTAYISYLGDTQYNPYNTSININVEGIDAVLIVSLDNITVGETALINISGLEDMSENVTLIINGTEYTGTFISGQARISIEGLEEGTHTFNVYYPGDTKYNPCTTSDEITVYPQS